MPLSSFPCQDYFYYSQIRSQDENTTKARVLDGMIPVEEIPHLMCALGYFPTQLEITNMTNEVKYSKLAETSDLGCCDPLHRDRVDVSHVWQPDSYLHFS